MISHQYPENDVITRFRKDKILHFRPTDVDVCLYNIKFKYTRFQIMQDICIGHDIILGVDFFMISDLIINLASRKISKVFCDGSRIDLIVYRYGRGIVARYT